MVDTAQSRRRDFDRQAGRGWLRAKTAPLDEAGRQVKIDGIGVLRNPIIAEQPCEIRAEAMVQLQFYIRPVFEKRVELDTSPRDDAHRPFGYDANGSLLVSDICDLTDELAVAELGDFFSV